MEVMIQDNLPDTEVNEYQKEFRKVPEANLFNSKNNGDMRLKP